MCTTMRLLLIVLSVTTGCVKSANILGVFPAPSVSHQIVFQPIWRELSLRGHKVTVITPNPLKDPTLTNLTEIDVGILYETFAPKILNELGRVRDHWHFTKLFMKYPVVEDMLAIEEVMKFFNNSDEHFDVVLGESVQPGNSIFSAIYNCPFIAVVSLSASSFLHKSIGNPTHPVLYPDAFTQYDDPPSFFERVDSFLYELWMEIYIEVDLLPRVDKIIKKHFGDNIPYLGNTERNFSLLLINSDPILQKARPYTHGVVEIGGGIHIKPKKPLPENLQTFLDTASEGVVYFSLGSNVKSINLDKSKQNLLLEVFSELPYKVLWKFENDSLNNKPRNVEISQWFPQNDVLGHPNVKLFITQAGLQSMEEAIYNEVPLLALPFFADQHINARRISYLGVGKHLDFELMSKEEFRDAILEVATDPRYEENVKKIHALLQDRPMTSLENAIWWIEYVIRHRGTPYFDSPVAKTSWSRWLMLDVIGFLLAIAIFGVYLLFKSINLILMLRPRGPRKEKKL